MPTCPNTRRIPAAPTPDPHQTLNDSRGRQHTTQAGRGGRQGEEVRAEASLPVQPHLDARQRGVVGDVCPAVLRRRGAHKRVLRAARGARATHKVRPHQAATESERRAALVPLPPRRRAACTSSTHPVDEALHVHRRLWHVARIPRPAVDHRLAAARAVAAAAAAALAARPHAPRGLAAHGAAAAVAVGVRAARRRHQLGVQPLDAPLPRLLLAVPVQGVERGRRQQRHAHDGAGDNAANHGACALTR